MLIGWMNETFLMSLSSEGPAKLPHCLHGMILHGGQGRRWPSTLCGHPLWMDTEFVPLISAEVDTVPMSPRAYVHVSL